jgi:putative membrane protein
MKKILLATAFGLSLASASAPFLAPAVSAESLAEKTGVNSLLGLSPSTADFVTQAAMSDMFEIQSSQLALRRGDDATKGFAQQMITDHQKTSAELTALVQGVSSKATMPTDLDAPHRKMLDTLNGLNGAAFDRQYSRDQVSGHKDAVSLFQRYAKGGDSTAIRQWADTTLPTLEHHLMMAQHLNEQLAQQTQ